MAKLTINHRKTDRFPEYSEVIEVRVWGTVGNLDQIFYIGGGANHQAIGTFILEVVYSVDGIPAFYSRNFLQESLHFQEDPPLVYLNKFIDDFLQEGKGRLKFGEYLPETSIQFILPEPFKHTSEEDENDEPEEGWIPPPKMEIPSGLGEDFDPFPQSSSHETDWTQVRGDFEINLDTGSVFAFGGPGDRFISFRINSISQGEVIPFFRELAQEMADAYQGKHPDPAQFPEGSSTWSFGQEMNRRAYDRVGAKFRQQYFENPLTQAAFDAFLAQTPSGGHVLDVGCGHGELVIARLLEKGCQVTGCDLSPEMLRLARQQFPQVTLINQDASLLTQVAEFDAACSFSSLIYLDPIDLLNSIRRLHRALKPGGLLFLYGDSIGPDWCGDPFYFIMDNWMWNWHYSLEEAVKLLEEHGYFEVIDSQKVKFDEEEDERIAREREEDRLAEEEYYRKQEQEPSESGFILPYFKKIISRSSYTYVITARRLG